MTMLPKLDPKTQEAPRNANIVLDKQLVTMTLHEIDEKTGVDKARLQELSTSGWYIIQEDRWPQTEMEGLLDSLEVASNPTNSLMDILEPCGVGDSNMALPTWTERTACGESHANL